MSRLSFIVKGTLFSVLVLALCATSASYGQRGSAGGAPQRVAVVAGPATEILPAIQKKYIGNVEAIEQVDSVARVSGTLSVAPDFAEGSHVKKGQLLFEIDPIPYQAKVDAAKASIAQIQARISYAESNYNRLSDLFDKNAGSKDDMESALATLQSYRAELASAKAQLTLAEEDLKYTKIVSQIDGRAGRRAYSPGNYVTPQSLPLIRVVQMDPIYIRFTMSERDYISMFGNSDSLVANAKIDLRLPNDEQYGEPGKISFVDNSVKSTTDTIKVWATFSNSNETLSPGGVVTVNLSKPETETRPSVEPSAILFDGRTNYVYELVEEISDDDLYKAIVESGAHARELEAIENGETTKAEYLAKFKKDRYEYDDPKTQEHVNDFANNKVNPKFRMAVRRNVTLGPTMKFVKEDGTEAELTSIYSGINVGDVIMMDGVNKARPFDLVKPVFRNAAPKAQDETQAQSDENKSSKQTAPASAQPSAPGVAK